MKISEMTNDQAAEALIRISEPIRNLCDDDELVALIDKAGTMKEQPFIKTLGQMVPDLVLYAMRKHKNDLYEIVGALTQQPLAKVGKMNFVQTVQAVKDSYDEVLRDFFTSSIPQTQNVVTLSPNV